MSQIKKNDLLLCLQGSEPWDKSLREGQHYIADSDTILNHGAGYRVRVKTLSGINLGLWSPKRFKILPGI